jgi:hypothetical protein
MADKPAAPQIADSAINAQAAEGLRMFKLQREGAPRVFNPVAPVGGQGWKDALITGLLGLQAGTQAATSSSKYGDPTVGLLAGLGAGASVPGMMDEMRMKQLEATPVDQVSPGLVESYPELRGIPLGMVHKLAPLLGRLHGYESQISMAKFKSGLQDDRNNVSAEEAKLYEKTFKIPAEMFAGKDKQIVKDQVAGFKPFQKQAEAIMQAENQVRVLRKKWDEVKGDVGAFEGRARGLSRGYGGKENAKLVAYENARQAAITSIRKLFADSGAPSNFDVDRYANAIPGVEVNAARAMELWDFLEQSNASGKSSLIQASPLVQYTFDTRMPSLPRMQAPAATDVPAAPAYKQTATNPKTGQKIGLNAATGKWEVLP